MADAAKRRRTQEERRLESEQRIIKAARELFAQQGYVRTTLTQVGERAGYTGGLVTHRFQSKEGLLRAVLDHISTRFLEDQVGPAIERNTAEESIAAGVEVYLREVVLRESRIRALYVIMGEALGAVPEVADQIADLNRRFRSHLAELVKTGIDDGEFRADLSPNDAAVLILALLRGVTMQVLVDPHEVRLEHIAPLVKEQVAASLRKNDR